MHRLRGALALVVVLAACGGDDATVAPTTTSTTTTSTSQERPACVPPGPERPEGADVAIAPDVDGDGKADELWLVSDPSGTVTVGITTAAGGGATAPFASASPVERRALAVDVDEQPPVEVLLSDGRSVRLLVFTDCTLAEVQNPEGEPYTFDRGFTEAGTGVGCIDADGDGRQDLVGLLAEPGEGADVRWHRTVVELDGTRARNGETDTGTYTSPDEDEAIALLSDVTCGDLTLDDGVTLDA